MAPELVLPRRQPLLSLYCLAPQLGYEPYIFFGTANANLYGDSACLVRTPVGSKPCAMETADFYYLFLTAENSTII